MSSLGLENHPCIYSSLACFSLALLYVGSLYVWRDSGLSRDHPNVIKRRTFSVFGVMLIAPCVTWIVLEDKELSQESLFAIIGLRIDGLLPAILYSLLLTNILFLGPLLMINWRDLISCDFDWIWLRNYIIAPLSEEWVFRGCMMPLWVQCGCWDWVSAVLMCPLWFGVAHAHHIWDLMKSGMVWQQAVVISLFQFSYTTLFGAYSALLFIKTGHLVAPIIAHSYCNMMGFPDLRQLTNYSQPWKGIVMCSFVFGFLLWCYSLPLLTRTSLFSNNVYGKFIH